MRSAFGLQGQKCSACSRVYVHRDVEGAVHEARSSRRRRGSRIGDPARHGVVPRPRDPRARRSDAYARAAEEARRDGRVLAGGEVRCGRAISAHGYFVAPTIVDGLPKDHALFRDELFVPFVCVAAVGSLDEAIDLANRTEYGLTAGFFSARAGGDRHLPGAHRGRRRLRQPPRGRHHRRLAGRAALRRLEGQRLVGQGSGGLYYVQQFMREQSRTIVE